MSQTTQQNADLSDHVYNDDIRPGIRRPNERDEHIIGGVKYKILEHYRNPRTDYEGTIYQRVDTGDIVVAHRGTEVAAGMGSLAKDVGVDTAMVVARANPQANDAIELTRRAINTANEIGKTKGHYPDVTVTGHSLGGTLAQISAHHFDLKGETFNAFGAASLGRGIPSGNLHGGKEVINHVMASDFVSAASPHYGEVRQYASPKEVAVLNAAKYDNNDNIVFDVRNPGLAHTMLLGTHGIHNFTNVDGDGRKDRSILAEPQARRLAADFAPMLEKFRNEIAMPRKLATGIADMFLSDDEKGRTIVEPGVRGRREGTTLKENVVIPPLPDYLRDGHKPVRSGASLDSPSIDQPLPFNPQQAIDKLSPKDREVFDQTLRLAQQQGLPMDKAQNAAMVVTATVREDPLLQRVDRMVVANDRVFASYHPHGDREPIFQTNIDLKQAAQVPMDDSVRRIEQGQQLQLAQQQHNPTQDDPSRDPHRNGPRMG